MDKCVVHTTFPNSYYCTTCLQYICPQCVLTTHKTCETVTREKSLSFVREQITAFEKGFCSGKEKHQSELARLQEAEAELRQQLRDNLDSQAAVRALLREQWDAEALAATVLQQEPTVLASTQLLTELHALAQKLQTEVTLATARLDATYLYAVGGYDGSNDLASVERYDPANNTWSACAAMSTKRSNFDVAVLVGHLYAVGGCDNSENTLASVERYDPANNTWSACAAMSTTRSCLGVAVPVRGRWIR